MFSLLLSSLIHPLQYITNKNAAVKKTKWPMKWFTKFSHPDHHNVQWCENGEWQTKYWCHKSGKQEPIDECKRIDYSF
jgi:hypothetical protein